MKVIVVANHKGGGGKTTVTSHLAVEAERSGAGPIAIMDLDPKNNLTDWWNTRKAETPLFAAPLLGGLAQDLRALENKGVELVFIDTPPGMNTASATTIAAADLLLIPIVPSPNDLRAIASTLCLIKDAKKPMVFVINLVKSVQMADGMAGILSPYGTVAINMISNRALYASSMVDGRAAPEFGLTGPAAHEIAKLWTYVNLRLQEAISSRDSAPPPPPVDRTPRPRSAAASPVAKVQVGLRLTQERYEQLCRLSCELREPNQAIIEESLSRFMDYLDEGSEPPD